MNDTKMKKTFERNLNALMKKNLLQRESLSRLTGVGMSQIARWQAGALLPTWDDLVRVTEIFGVEVEDLLGESCGRKTYESRTK